MEPSPGSPESQLIGAPARTRPDLATKANPISYMHEGVPSCLLLHGRRDEFVACRQSEMLYEALVARRNRATLCLIKGLGHGFLNDSAIDVQGPYEMMVRSSAEEPLAPATVRQNYVFPFIEEFFRATL